MPYAEVWTVQHERVGQRIRGEVPDALFLVEHHRVITVGRGWKGGGIYGDDFPVFEVERGGQATYHGPGQLVGYPILLLPEGRRDAHRYLRDLEQILIDALLAFGIRGSRQEGKTGVWVGEKKIASIGVALRKWVTYHGFALNVSTDLSHFKAIDPCGMPADVMTSMEVVLDRPVLLDDVRTTVTQTFFKNW